MTVLSPYKDNKEYLEELLIKNLPPMIKAGNDKHNSNIFEIPTHQALKRCKFINFNTKERISFMIFDFDTYHDKNAIETFKNIDMFYDYVVKHLGIEPTFITQTNKGYHFAYHLKNQVFTHQKKALNYLNDIKRGIIKKLGCDIHGSTRNYGVWRNPLKHYHYFSQKINYELRDFTEFAISQTTQQQKFQRDITVRQINQHILVKGNRNNVIFGATMKWAKHQKSLKQEDIYIYASKYNNKAQEPLENDEIIEISKSVYRYYCQGLIYTSTNKKNINEGAMKFEKMKNLTRADYEKEVKKRQRLSAKRTNELQDKDKQKEQMLKAKNIHIGNVKRDNLSKVKSAINELTKLNQKLNNTSISKLAGLDRKTVSKYRKF